MLQGKWYFPSNGYGVFNGINDPGITTFTADITGHVNSLVREVIQNSLDAVKDDGKPVVVEFNQFELSNVHFPGQARFENVLRECLEENKTESDVVKFFESAIRCFEAPIKVLRISDFNTKGLEGAQTNDYKSSWGRLVKCNGASNQNSTAGGSYGIGKSASFLCSELHTVFYSSLDMQDVKSTIGVTRLISFKDSEHNGEMTTGQGFFSNSCKIDAILSFPDFEKDYTRMESGTDIYIMGMTDVENLKQKLVQAVLENFLVSIWSGKLEVIIKKLQPIRLCKESLGEYVQSVTEGMIESTYQKKLATQMRNYYQLLTISPLENQNIKKIPLDSQKFGKKYGFQDGESTLFLMRKKDADRRVMMTRASGMKLFLKDHLPRSIEFTGILYITGSKMNEEFRKMETPTHDKWAETSSACRGNEKMYRAMKHELYAYIKKTIIDSFGSRFEDTVDAFGANEFLPDTDSRITEPGHDTSFLPKVETGILKKMTGIHLPKQTRESEKHGGDGDDRRKRPRGNNGRKRRGNGMNAGDGNRFLTFKPVAIPGIRCVCRNEKEGCFRLALRIPHTVKCARIQLDVSGEQSAFSIPIKEATVVKGKAEIRKLTENYVELSKLKLNDVVVVDVKLAFNRFCLLEVSYSEAK